MARRSSIPRGARIRNVASSGDPASGLQQATYTGLPDGMGPAIPAHELPDTMARLIVDAFVHNPGLVVRRGPVTAIGGIANLPFPCCGLVSVVDPTGVTRVAALHGNASNGYLGVWNTSFTTRNDLALGVNLPQSPYQIVQVGARLNGGVYLTIQDKTSQGANQYLIFWKGSGAPVYTTGTITTTRGSTSVTGSGTAWGVNTQPGSFVFANSQYAGVVKSVQSDTALTLEDNALVSQSGTTYSIQPFRGINPRVGKGFITTSTINATVNGANTKFQADGLGTGTWDIFRSSDFTFIGTVTSVTSDIQLTFTANSTLNLSQEPYTAIRRDGSYALGPRIGVISTVWAGRQAYANNAANMANTSKIWFSSVDDAEALDEATTDGDFITCPSVGPAGTATPIVSMTPTPASLLILKENEAYGLFGSATAQFSIQPISSDGCLSPMAVQSWNGLVIYPGRQGIYMFDGTEAENVTEETLGWYYQQCVKDFDTTQYRMWSMIDKDHYLLFIESATPPIPILKGTASRVQTNITFAVHLPTQAVTVLENVHVRASLQLPSSLGHTTWYAVTNPSAQAVICSADTLFVSAGLDDFGCDGGVAGPDFYLETKKYSFGDSLLKKLWKLILLTYTTTGDSLRLDTVPGLNEQGTTSTTVFPSSGLTWAQLAALNLTWSQVPAVFPTWKSFGTNFVTKRIKFLKRTQMMSFRIYQNSSAVTSLALGPWSIVVKPQRIGRT